MNLNLIGNILGNTGNSAGGGSDVPSNALLWDDGTPILWDDGTYILWE